MNNFIQQIQVIWKGQILTKPELSKNDKRWSRKDEYFYIHQKKIHAYIENLFLLLKEFKFIYSFEELLKLVNDEGNIPPLSESHQAIYSQSRKVIYVSTTYARNLF